MTAAEFSSIPLPETPARKTYERAYFEANDIMMASLELDEHIQQLRSMVARDGFHKEAALYTDEIKQRNAKILDNHTEQTVRSWTDYFRLKTQNAFLFESVITPTLFSDSSSYNQRKQLTDGLSGVGATVLEEALNLYAKPHIDDEERAELKGAIAELTNLALLNRSQDSSRVALPADTASDLFHKTDAFYWRIHRGQCSTTKIQVKSSPYHGAIESLPDDIVAVTNQTLYNTDGRFTIAKLLRQENAYGLSNDASTLLDLASRKLIQHVEPTNT